MSLNKKELMRLRERSAKHYANQPDAFFKEEKALNIGLTLKRKAKKYKGFSFID